MQLIAYTKINRESKSNLREDCEKVLSVVIESGDRGIQIQDIAGLTGLDWNSVLHVLRELERKGVIRSEIIDLCTEKWYTLTEVA